MKNPIREVIDRYTSHDYPDEVNRDFRSWLTDDTHIEEKERELSRIWESSDDNPSDTFEHSLQKMRSLTGIVDREKLRRMHKRLIAWRMATAAVVAGVISLLTFMPLEKAYTPQADILQAYVPKADTHKVTLPDGTIALINANSTLLYPEKFSGSERCVFLIGEAAFKVRHDPEHPFVVKSSDMQITALGTEFNIAAYPDEEEIIATLINGKVRIDFNDLTRSEILTPSRQLVYNRATRKASTRDADIRDVTAWQRGETVLRGMTADEIFTRLARKYPYTFIYSPHSLKSDHYTLTFGADASFEEVMDITSKVIGDIRFRIEDDLCYIDPIR